MNSSINLAGPVAALATLSGIWLGHVLVRKVERQQVSLVLPILSCLVIGVGLISWSILMPNRLVSIAAGILAVTSLWDSLEFKRQERRVKNGHAPANPANPRHIIILKTYPNATIVDLLARQPTGESLTLLQAHDKVLTEKLP